MRGTDTENLLSAIVGIRNGLGHLATRLYTLERTMAAPKPAGCICPPGANATCTSPTCPRQSNASTRP